MYYYSLSEILDIMVNITDKPGKKPEKLTLPNSYLPIKMSIICPSEAFSTQIGNLLT